MSAEIRPGCYAKIRDPQEIVVQIDTDGKAPILKRSPQLFDGQPCEDATCDLFSKCLSGGNIIPKITDYETISPETENNS